MCLREWAACLPPACLLTPEWAVWFADERLELNASPPAQCWQQAEQHCHQTLPRCRQPASASTATDTSRRFLSKVIMPVVDHPPLACPLQPAFCQLAQAQPAVWREPPAWVHRHARATAAAHRSARLCAHEVGRKAQEWPRAGTQPCCGTCCQWSLPRCTADHAPLAHVTPSAHWQTPHGVGRHAVHASPRWGALHFFVLPSLQRPA